MFRLSKGWVRAFFVWSALGLLLTACAWNISPPNSPDTTMDYGESSKRSLTFWTFYQTDSVEQQFWINLAKKYTDQIDPQVKINVESVSWNDYLSDKLINAFAAGEGPDLFLVAPPTFLQYYNAGVLQELNPYLGSDAIKDFLPNTLDSTIVDGKIYAIPYEQDLAGLFYDEDVLNAAGIEPPKTWEELKSAALKLKAAGKPGISLEIGATSFQVFMFSPFLWSAGGDILTPDRKHSALLSEGVKQALGYWRDLWQAGVIIRNPTRAAGEIEILGEGEASMQLSGSWVINTLEHQYPNRNIGVVPIPIPAGGSSVTVTGGWKIAVNRNGDNNTDATKFVAWAFGSPDSSFHKNWDTLVKFAFPVRQSVLVQAKETYHMGLREAFAEQMLGTERSEMRIPPEMSKILIDMIQESLYNPETSIDEIVLKYHRKLEQFLAGYQGQL